MYPSFPVGESRLLSSPHKFKLAVFGINSQGGCTITEAPGTVYPTWGEQVQIAQLAERANIDALLPGARWAGYGGKTDFQSRTFEPFPWAAALAAITSRIQVFATYHIPTAHPVRVAKTIATIDHIARGRFGMNIVAGWNTHEIEMFGSEQREHDLRYDYAADFLDVVQELLTREGRFDIDSKYFDIKQAFSEPKPIQTPRPVYMAAGLSPVGRDFAAKYADISFIPAGDLTQAAGIIADTKARAKESYHRDILVFGQSTIVCADTEKEAKDYLHYYVDEMGDWEAARNLVSVLFAQTRDVTTGQQHAALPAPDRNNPMLRAMVAGHGGLPIVGTPEQIVEGFIARSNAGLDGAAISWLNYADGLVQFREQILPLMIQAGLRVEEDEPPPAVLPQPAPVGTVA